MTQFVNEVQRGIGTLRNYVSTDAVDVIGVYLPDFSPVFQQAKAMRVNVNAQSRLPEHPLENGSVVVDHRIIMPIEIELLMWLSVQRYEDLYRQIQQTYLNADFLTVQTQAGVYENMVIEGIPHVEDAERYNVIILSLRLKEVRITEIVETTITPQNATNSNTQERGVIQADAANDSQTNDASLAYQLFYG